MIENILERNIYIYANIYRRMMKEILEKPKQEQKYIILLVIQKINLYIQKSENQKAFDRKAFIKHGMCC